MEITKTAIIAKAGQIIINSGIEALTIHNISRGLDIEDTQLSKQLSNDDDILLLLLLGFETDINEILKVLTKKGASPETELKLLFEGLDFLFRQKPYYLSIIFDKSLKERDDRIYKSFLRIKSTAENYLTSIIDSGKNKNIFKTKVSTKVLVDRMLPGFQGYMKDEHRFNEMIREIKSLRTLKD